MSDRMAEFWKWVGGHVVEALVGLAFAGSFAWITTSISDVAGMGAAFPLPFWKLVVFSVAFGAVLGYGASVLLGVRDARARREEARIEDEERVRREREARAERERSEDEDRRQHEAEVRARVNRMSMVVRDVLLSLYEDGHRSVGRQWLDTYDPYGDMRFFTVARNVESGRVRLDLKDAEREVLSRNLDLFEEVVEKRKKEVAALNSVPPAPMVPSDKGGAPVMRPTTGNQ